MAYGDFSTLLHIAPLQFRLKCKYVKCLLLVLKQSSNYLSMNNNYVWLPYRHSRVLWGLIFVLNAILYTSTNSNRQRIFSSIQLLFNLHSFQLSSDYLNKNSVIDATSAFTGIVSSIQRLANKEFFHQSTFNLQMIVLSIQLLVNKDFFHIKQSKPCIITT